MAGTLYLGGRSGIHQQHLTPFFFCLGGTCSASWNSDPVNLNIGSLLFFMVFHFSWQLLP